MMLAEYLLPGIVFILILSVFWQWWKLRYILQPLLARFINCWPT